MNIRIKPPCRVRIEGDTSVLILRRVGYASFSLKKKGWKGLVAYVQNEKGISIAEYKKLRKVE